MLPASAGDARETGDAQYFLVLYADDASLTEGRAAVAAAGGTIIAENAVVGLAEVVSTSPTFLDDVRAQHAVKGGARDRSIGTARPGMGHKFADERLDEERASPCLIAAARRSNPRPGQIRCRATSGTCG